MSVEKTEETIMHTCGHSRTFRFRAGRMGRMDRYKEIGRACGECRHRDNNLAREGASAETREHIERALADGNPIRIPPGSEANYLPHGTTIDLGPMPDRLWKCTIAGMTRDGRTLQAGSKGATPYSAMRRAAQLWFRAYRRATENE